MSLCIEIETAENSYHAAILKSCCSYLACLWTNADGQLFQSLQLGRVCAGNGFLLSKDAKISS